jgi:hypothetical protein
MFLVHQGRKFWVSRSYRKTPAPWKDCAREMKLPSRFKSWRASLQLLWVIQQPDLARIMIRRLSSRSTRTKLL